MAEPCTKGLSFRTFMRCLRALKGEPVVAATIGHLSPDLAGRIRGDLFFTGNWYPLAWYRELHAAAARASGGSPGLARAIGRESVKGDLAGIYRVFLLVVSPHFLLARAPRLFSNYYDTGTMEVLEVESGQGRARWVGCTGFDANVWQDVLGGCEGALIAAGARDLKLTIASGGGDGDTEMVISARWI